jgi:hypothetical protein
MDDDDLAFELGLMIDDIRTVMDSRVEAAGPAHADVIDLAEAIVCLSRVKKRAAERLRHNNKKEK